MLVLASDKCYSFSYWPGGTQLQDFSSKDGRSGVGPDERLGCHCDTAHASASTTASSNGAKFSSVTVFAGMLG